MDIAILRADNQRDSSAATIIIAFGGRGRKRRSNIIDNEFAGIGEITGRVHAPGISEYSAD